MFAPMPLARCFFYLKLFEILIETNHLQYLLEKEAANRISKIEVSYIFLTVNEVVILCPCAQK